MPDADFYPEPQAKPKHPAGMYAGKYVDILAEYTGLGGVKLMEVVLPDGSTKTVYAQEVKRG